MKKKIIIIFAILSLVLAALILRPVPIVTESKALVVNGIVSDIYEGGAKDIAFKLKYDNRIYYINRGLERGLEIGDLKQNLVGKEVILKYPKHWTPLDWNDKIKHISKVESSGQVFFNELKK
ncbi:hypothetical protein [Winogradskyella sp. UBA3174]|uniref:hypothetical protein n=1 Tax=Winogradskyella sp. UBA3174 TaxID=1947785 RepID=UPI0025D29E82|nr:hypothetical protein [Winogradskyella sp. UBA3174]|tara:strand:+ start:150 stop:515 length:366 start_codon:yes stop_codon:yes gene_type:complete